MPLLPSQSVDGTNRMPIATPVTNPFSSLCKDMEKLHGDQKIEFLQSQIIGNNAEFDGPFGRRRITYSDHTASGRFLQFIEDFIQQQVLPFYGNTHTVDSYVGLHTSRLVQKAHQYIKACMGAGPKDVLIFCGSGSTSAIKRLQDVMGISVPSLLRPMILNNLQPSDQWVVFVGPYEHHSNLLSWRQSLAEVIEIGLDEQGFLDLKALENALQLPEYSGRPKLGAFSACSNVTGVYTNTRAVARMLHEHGAFACFDFACSGPYVEMEMRSEKSDGYDALFLSPHKFLGGPCTPGILLMSSALYRLTDRPPSTSGGGVVRYVNGYDDQDTLYCANVEEREDAGTPAIVQKIRAALAFRVKELIGYNAISDGEKCLLRRAVKRIKGNPQVRVLGGGSMDYERQPILSFLVYPYGYGTHSCRHLHCHFVTKLLNDLFGVQARGGCACAGPYGHVLLSIGRDRAKAIRSVVEKGYEGVKPGWTRVSFAYYTSIEEMEFVVDAIEFIALYGQRFLPLYNFSWITGEWEFNKNINVNIGVISSSQQQSTKKSFDDYLRIARSIACQLPDPVSQLPEESKIPSCVDPQLVNFLL